MRARCAGGNDKKTAKKLAAQRVKTLSATLLRASVDKKVLLVKPAKGPREDQVTLVSLMVDKKATTAAGMTRPPRAKKPGLREPSSSRARHQVPDVHRDASVSQQRGSFIEHGRWAGACASNGPR